MLLQVLQVLQLLLLLLLLPLEADAWEAIACRRVPSAAVYLWMMMMEGTDDTATG